MGKYRNGIILLFIIVLLVANRAFASDLSTSSAETSQTIIISGKVIDMNAHVPVPNFRLQFESGGKNDMAQIKTDSSGGFRIEASRNQWARIRIREEEEGDYLIDREWLHQNRVERRGDMFRTVDHSIAFDGGTTCNLTNLVLPVKLIPLRSLTGYVIDETGQPTWCDWISCDQNLPTTSTAERGFFRLKSVPAKQNFKLLALAKNGNNFFYGVSSVDPRTTETTIMLKLGTGIKGRMVTNEGFPAQNLSFMLMPVQNEGKAFKFSSLLAASYTTDVSGCFTIPFVFPGLDYQASWGSPNNPPCYDPQEIRIRADDIAKKGFIGAGVKYFPNIISGIVVNQAGVPISNAVVGAIRGQDSFIPKYSSRYARTAEDGLFKLGPLGVGRIELEISSKGYLSQKITLATNEANARIVLQTIPDELLYQLRAGDESGTPLPQIPISIWFSYTAGDAVGDARDSVTLTTDANGMASYKWRTAGFLGRGGLIHCDVPGYSKYFRGFSTDDDDRNLSITLSKRSVSYRGRILDQNKLPVAGAKVKAFYLVPESLKDILSSVAFIDNTLDFLCWTDAKGEFRFDRISPKDNLSFTIAAQGYADEFGLFHSSGVSQEKTFTIMPGGSVKGRVVLAGEASLPDGMECSVRPITTGGPNSHDTPVRKDGSFEIQGLKPGLYEIWCTSRRFNASSDSSIKEKSFPNVCVEAGKTKEAAVEMQRSYKVKVKVNWKSAKTLPPGNASLYAKGENGSRAGINNGICELYLVPGTYQFEYQDGLGKAPVKPEVLVVGKAGQNVAVEIER